MELKHGGDIVGFFNQYGRAPLDFSASLNPFGLPPAVAAAAKKAVDAAVDYPDPLCRELTRALANKLGIREEWIVFGNGAADIVYRFVDAVKLTLSFIPSPTFSEYERALSVRGCAVERHLLHEKDNFQLTRATVLAMPDKADAVFLCQPNNPTGYAITPDVLGAFAEQCAPRNAWLFIDECFCPFLDNAASITAVRRLQSMRKLFVLGSFTKLYGMAGIRLGYGLCSDTDCVEAVRASGQPWAVSTIALAAGRAALDEEQYVRQSLAAIAEEKNFLRDELAALGCTVYGSDANFIFFHCQTPELHKKLAKSGILIRDCANFPGLETGYYRIAVKLRKQNERLLQAME